MGHVKQLVLRSLAVLLSIAATTSAAQVTSSTSAQTSREEGSTSQQIFSGPQIGEKITGFKVRGVFDDWAGKEFDFVTNASGKPVVLIFVHEVNRQSISFTRILSTYTLGRSSQIATGIVWLVDDLTEGENGLKRMRHALGPTPPNKESKTEDRKTPLSKSAETSDILQRLPSAIGLSLDGREGPGSYGLNRNVTLTILVAKGNVVTANFALVQPSLQVDLPKVLDSIVKIAGGTVPKLSDLNGMPSMAAGESNSATPNLRPLLQPLIRLNATKEEVEVAAAAIEKQATDDPATRREIARIANTIIDSGKLENYGTVAAQEYLTKWSKEFKDK